MNRKLTPADRRRAALYATRVDHLLWSARQPESVQRLREVRDFLLDVSPLPADYVELSDRTPDDAP